MVSPEVGVERLNSCPGAVLGEQCSPQECTEATGEGLWEGPSQNPVEACGKGPARIQWRPWGDVFLLLNLSLPVWMST